MSLESKSRNFNKFQNEKNIDSSSEIISLIVFAIITAGLWQFEIGRYILYPFTIMGTYFHEMSHGIAALLLGANFQKLELFPNGSGIATYSSDVLLGKYGEAIVAGAGPLGPAIFGSIFIYASKKEKSTKIILNLFSILLILSVILWIRTLFGIVVISLFGIGIIIFVKKFSVKSKKLLLQFIGIQGIMSIYLSIGYLYSTGANIEQSSYMSDTQVMQNALILPYWFWASFLLMISILLLFLSYRYLYKKQ